MDRLLAPARRLWRDSGANMAIMMALAMPVVLIAAALAVDEAALYYQKRGLQAGVDLAAIYAAGDPGEAAPRARRALIDSGHLREDQPLETLLAPAGPLLVETGHYARDPGRAARKRFTPGGAPVNAVRVGLSRPGDLHFARTFMSTPPRMEARALASGSAAAGFAIGSRLVSLEGGVANALLGSLLGTSLSLSLFDYEAVAGIEIGLLDVLDALAGRIGIEAGTYGQVLDSRVAVADIAAAIAAAASGADPYGVDILAGLAGRIDRSVTVRTADIVALDGLAGLGLGTPGAGLAATVSALELLSVSAILADGERQAALDFGAGVPGLAGVGVRLVVGEPMQGAWYAIGREGAFVRTAQVRLRIDISVLGHGGTGIGLLEIGLPVYAELAPAQAELARLDCPPGRPLAAAAYLDVSPGVLRLAVGRTPKAAFLDTANRFAVERAPIVAVGAIAQVSARADVAMIQPSPQRLRFDLDDARTGRVKTVRLDRPVSALTRDLAANLDLRLDLLGSNLLGGLLGGVLSRVTQLLGPVPAGLDAVLNTVFAVLGLGLGEADVRVLGIDCRAAVLVQ